MNILTGALMIIGGFIAVLAGVGILRFDTALGRFHAAGKASPVAFLVVATGASLSLGGAPAAFLAIAVVAMVLTLPVGVHLLFRAVYRSNRPLLLVVDELGPVTQNRRPNRFPNSNP